MFSQRAKKLKCILIVAIFVLASTNIMAAIETTQPAVSQVHRDYSGLDCLCKAMNLIGKQTNILDLLHNEQSDDPAEPAHLAQLASGSGVFATPITGMNTRQLHRIPYPVLLRVKGGPLSADYDKFVLYTGVQEGSAAIYNPPNPDKQLPFYLLAERWNGTGIVISPQPIQKFDFPVESLSTSYSTAGVISVIFVVAVWMWRRHRPMLPSRSRRAAIVMSSLQVPGMIVVAALLGLLHHKFHADGFLAPSNAQLASFTVPDTAIDFLPPLDPQKPPMPEVDLAEARRLNSEGVLFVDARSEPEFRGGHINGAINIPELDSVHRRLSMAGISKNIRLIVYCVNAQCPRARVLASGLHDDGYTNIAVFEGGWSAWKR